MLLHCGLPGDVAFAQPGATDGDASVHPGSLPRISTLRGHGYRLEL
ncbi:hypothetical protein [Streptomyces sp. NRRL S-1022]|nr:hypothetical protein [Streptomyces sp. NRRL S-1022]